MEAGTDEKASQNEVGRTHMSINGQEAQDGKVDSQVNRWRRKKNGDIDHSAKGVADNKQVPNKFEVNRSLGGRFSHMKHSKDEQGFHAVESHWTSNKCLGSCKLTPHPASGIHGDTHGNPLHIKGFGMNTTVQRMPAKDGEKFDPKNYRIAVNHPGSKEPIIKSVKVDKTVDADGAEKTVEKTKIHLDGEQAASITSHGKQLRNAAKIANQGRKAARAEEAAVAVGEAAGEDVLAATVFGVDIAAAPIVIAIVLTAAVMWEIWNIVDHDRAQKFKLKFLGHFHSAWAKAIPCHPHHGGAKTAMMTNPVTKQSGSHIHFTAPWNKKSKGRGKSAADKTSQPAAAPAQPPPTSQPAGVAAA